VVRQLGFIARRSALALFFTGVLFASGCASNIRGVFHVPVPKVGPATLVASQENQLIHELQQEAPLPSALTTPEELAAMARAELIAARLWDAGVLMSMASHRHYTLARAVTGESSDEGYDRASKHMHGLHRGLYNQLIAAEVKLLLDLDYSEQVDRISALLGVPLDPSSVREDLVRVALGNIRNRHQAEAAVTQRVEHLKEPPAEQLHHPRLAQAWVAHLKHSIENDEYPGWATRALARTPLASAWQAALESVRTYVFFDVALASALLYARTPDAVVGALRSRRPETRANAAVALGIIEDLGTLPALETALNAETNPRAQLSIRYALARLGEPKHLEQLVQAMASQNADVRNHALLLGQWLREDLKRRVPEGPYVRAIHDKATPKGLREVCVMMLGNLGALRPLGEPTIDALLQAALEGQDGDPFRDVVGDAFAQIDQLDRGRVLASLRAGTPPVRPWLHRLAEIAEPQDLELLGRLMASSDREHTGKREDIVQVAGKIPGEAAQALLQRWYREDKNLRAVIAFTLILRNDVDKEQLWQLAQTTKDVFSLALRMPLGREDLAPVLSVFLKSKSLEDRAFAARVIGLFGTREHAGLLGPTLHYRDNGTYPAEVVLRHLAVASLIDIELNMRRAQASYEAEPAPAQEPPAPEAPAPVPPAAPLEPIPEPTS
jgi:HEAT repeat protein